MWDAPAISSDELAAVESAYVAALSRRSIADLRVLGFGELGLAVGWPGAAPRVVCKRQAPGRPAEVRADVDRMVAYQRALEDAGASLVPTLVEAVDIGPDWSVPYLVQPVLDPSVLADHVLADAAPDPEHPIIVDLRDLTVDVVRDDSELGLSIDGQVTNFAWAGDRLHILDTTPPLIWDATDGPFYDVGAYLHAIPAPLRSTALSITRRNGNDYRTVRGTLMRTAMYLHRIEQERWVAPALTAFNEVIDDPLTLDEIWSGYQAAIKDFPLIKRLARIQRFWVERLRRGRYEFFITDSFNGQIL